MAVTPSGSSITRAENMGRRAGQAYRSTGVPERCPFDDTVPELRDAWTRAYVDAAYR